MTKTKTVYLWIVDWSFCTSNQSSRITADLFFSSIEKFRELYTGSDADQEQLVPVQVPEDFTWLDFIPDNY